MTPTLFGRWQTRIFLLATIGSLITLFFYVVKNGDSLFFCILLYVALFGIAWDLLYMYIQKFRWDRDWPGAFQLLAGIWEALFILGLIKTIGLPGVSNQKFDLFWFICHYSAVWLGVYLASQSLMRIVFPRWRFRGGQLF
ncbi:MAG: hypothetical protein WA865_04495 [Spirulinaceae cyanobacterium]